MHEPRHRARRRAPRKTHPVGDGGTCDADLAWTTTKRRLTRSARKSGMHRRTHQQPRHAETRPTSRAATRSRPTSAVEGQQKQPAPNKMDGIAANRASTGPQSAPNAGKRQARPGRSPRSTTKERDALAYLEPLGPASLKAPNKCRFRRCREQNSHRPLPS